MNILLLGGSGRVGSRVLAELTLAQFAHGLSVHAPSSSELDLTQMADTAAWQPWLHGIDVVIHAAGVLRESGADTFTAHGAALRALTRAAHTAKLQHLIALSGPGVRSGCAVPWFAARGAAETDIGTACVPATILRCGALYLDGVGSTRRFHPQALTLDWRAATGGLPMTHVTKVVAAVVRAALAAPPRGQTVLELAEPLLSRAA